MGKPKEFFFVLIQLKTAINRAIARNDLTTIRDALEVSAEMYKKDVNNVRDYVQRHLRSLSIWDELRYASLLLYELGLFIFKYVVASGFSPISAAHLFGLLITILLYAFCFKSF